MTARSKSTQQWGLAWLGAILATLAGWLFLTPLGDGLARLSYEIPFYFRPSAAITNVLILYMDDDSQMRLGQPSNRAWDRGIHARALELLAALKVKAVVLDILFEQPGIPGEDRALLQAAARNSNTFFAASVEADVNSDTGKLRVPFSEQLRWGVAETADADRYIWQHHRDTAFSAPTLAWVAAESTGVRDLPSPEAPRWLNYYGPPGTIPYFSYYKLFSNSIPAEAVAGKVIFIGTRYRVGPTGGLQTDDFFTPFTRWTGAKSPGAEVVATCYLNLARGDWLRTLPRVYETILLAIFGLLFGVGFSVLRPIPATCALVLSIAALGIVATMLTWGSLTWTPWLIPAAIQAPAALAWGILVHTKRLREENAAIETQLAEFTNAAQRPARSGPGGLPAQSAAQAAHASLNGAPPIPEYTLIRVIGRGGYGEVWLAQDVIGTFHAVKVVYRDKFPNIEPYEREFRGMKRFAPISRGLPGFVHILHVGRSEAAGYFYYVMEVGDDEKTGQQIDPATYCARTLARDLLEKRKPSLPQLACLATDLALALQNLHKRDLIHRDIKLSNVIFVNGAPKFADIGLVTQMRHEATDVSNVGTAPYMAPEGPGTAAADIYSLGKVFYELCTGRDVSRFPELPTALLDDISDAPAIIAFNRIVLKCCESDPARRYASAVDLHRDLLSWQQRCKTT